MLTTIDVSPWLCIFSEDDGPQCTDWHRARDPLHRRETRFLQNHRIPAGSRAARHGESSEKGPLCCGSDASMHLGGQAGRQPPMVDVPRLTSLDALVAVKDGRAIRKVQAVAAPRASARGRGNGGARSGAPWLGLSGWVMAM
eukprot:s1340_g11.t1